MEVILNRTQFLSWSLFIGIFALFYAQPELAASNIGNIEKAKAMGYDTVKDGADGILAIMFGPILYATGGLSLLWGLNACRKANSLDPMTVWGGIGMAAVLAPKLMNVFFTLTLS